MLANYLLNNSIEQDRLRNARIQQEREARLAGMPAQAVQPVENPILKNISSGGEFVHHWDTDYYDPFMQSDFNAITAANPMGNGQAVIDQREYDKAVAFNNPTTQLGQFAKAATPFPITAALSVMSDQTMMAAKNNPNVVLDTAAKPSILSQIAGLDTGVPTGVRSWGQAQRDNAPMKKEIDSAWHAQRAKFMNAEKQAEQAESDKGALSGFAGTQQGMTASNFGADAFDAAFGGSYDDMGSGPESGGGYDSGFGNAAVGGGGWGGAVGGDVGGDPSSVA